MGKQRRRDNHRCAPKKDGAPKRAARSAPVIREPILGGSGQISGSLRGERKQPCGFAACRCAAVGCLTWLSIWFVGDARGACSKGGNPDDSDRFRDRC
jgi:hypothetical protein